MFRSVTSRSPQGQQDKIVCFFQHWKQFFCCSVQQLAETIIHVSHLHHQNGSLFSYWQYNHDSVSGTAAIRQLVLLWTLLCHWDENFTLFFLKCCGKFGKINPDKVWSVCKEHHFLSIMTSSNLCVAPLKPLKLLHLLFINCYFFQGKTLQLKGSIVVFIHKSGNCALPGINTV